MESGRTKEYSLKKNKEGGYNLSAFGWIIGSTDEEYVKNHKGEQTVVLLDKDWCEDMISRIDDMWNKKAK